MPETNPPIEPPKPSAAPLITVDARALFQGQREIQIEHEGVRYRLRITRRNKLILQK
ncbi:MAG: hemin uptake protein HemP [Planctomycetia bacterium]|nr:hemin uptake protein HemP [Planctomycetia bacterium]